MHWIIDWPIVATYGGLAFVSALIANLLVVWVGDNRVVAAIIAGLIFIGLLICWTNVQLGFPGQPV